MNAKITIHVGYDDLSDECKRKIKLLKGQGNVVDIVWKDYKNKIIDDMFYDFPDSPYTAPYPIMPKQPIDINPSNPDPFTTPCRPETGPIVYCKDNSTINTTLTDVME